MGDLGVDTAVERVSEGRYRAVLSSDWEIWGPMGGYIASVALRAAGAESPFARPASFTCHYLGVAAFDAVDIEVTTLRSARTARSQRVEITQDGRRMLEATVWSVQRPAAEERVAAPGRPRSGGTRRAHGLDRTSLVRRRAPGCVRRRPAAVPADALGVTD